MSGKRKKTNEIGLAGEFYVIARLNHRGLIAVPTLGNTKGVDILVLNELSGKQYKVEVKTTQNKPRREKIFGPHSSYKWRMDKKHESIKDDNLIYCFVYLKPEGELPLFFLVPAKNVADYVEREHKLWVSAKRPKGKKVKVTNMRTFRIETHDSNGYLNNWEIFDK